jgi:hypothetical protein
LFSQNLGESILGAQIPSDSVVLEPLIDHPLLFSPLKLCILMGLMRRLNKLVAGPFSQLLLIKETNCLCLVRENTDNWDLIVEVVMRTNQDY